MFKRAIFAALVVSLSCAAGLRAETAAPNSTGLDSTGLNPAKLATFDEAIRTAVREGQIDGAAVVVYRHGKRVHQLAAGTIGPKHSTPVSLTTRFRIYSMTKPIVSVAALQLITAGKLSFDDPIDKYLPQFSPIEVVDSQGERAAPRRPPTVRDLLRHTSGLTYGFFGRGPVRAALKASAIRDPDQSAEDYIDKLVRAGLEHEPGTTWEYSHSSTVLGLVLEAASSQPLATLFEQNIFGPLKMTDTGFYVPALAPDESFAARNAFIRAGMRRRPNFASGGGGLISTANDYARFARMLLGGGALDGVRILSPDMAKAMVNDQLAPAAGQTPDFRENSKYFLPGPGYGFGYGVAVRTEKRSRMPGSVGDFWWGGYGGTLFWVDPKEALVTVFLIDKPRMRRYYRPFVRKAIYSALRD